MAKNKKKVNNTKDNNKIVNIIFTVGIVFLIASLIFMFVQNGQTSNSIKEIKYSEYEDIISKDEYAIILLTSPTCSHCLNYKPFVNYVAEEYQLKAYNIDLTTVTYEEYLEIRSRYTAIKNEVNDDGEPIIPTPVTIITKNNTEVASITGDIGYNGLVRLLKNNNVIK